MRDDPSFGEAIGSGLRWSLAGSVGTRLGTFVTGLVLARLLAPEDFGLYAVALGAMNFLMMVNDAGLIAATVQWRGDLNGMVPTATTMALAFSAAVYGLCWLGAPSFSALAGSPEAAPIVRLLTAVILVDGVTAVRAGSLLRSFQQSRITLANLAGMGVNATVAVGLALSGSGGWSLAAGHLAGHVVTGLLILQAAKLWTPPGFDPAVARKLLRFGLPLAASLGIEAILLNADYVIVGRVLGPAALGVYLLAFNVSSWVPGVLGGAIRHVSVAGFSRLSEDGGSLSSGVQRSFAMLMTAVLPIGLLLVILAPALVAFLYGGRWAPAAPALRFLAVLGIVRLLTLLVVDVLTGAGATRSAMWMNLGWGLTLVPALVVGSRIDGIRGAAVAHALVALVVAVPLALVALRRVGVRLAPIAPALVRPVLGGGLAACVCMLVARTASATPLLQLASAGSAGLVTYAAVVIPREELRRWRARAAALVATRMR